MGKDKIDLPRDAKPDRKQPLRRLPMRRESRADKLGMTKHDFLGDARPSKLTGNRHWLQKNDFPRDCAP
jgi:hypothetical protein